MSTEGAFDVVILGTGLTESITAAALSKAGYTVAHIDTNPHYGADQASLSLPELITWAASSPSRYTQITHTPTDALPPHSRSYALSLSPSIIPAIGPLVSSLVSSTVARYGGFKLLERVLIASPPTTPPTDHDHATKPKPKVSLVPSSKESIFTSKTLSLLDKRRLMRFLMFVSTSPFDDDPTLLTYPIGTYLQAVWGIHPTTEMHDAIVWALAFCQSDREPALHALLRIRAHLRSTGRYGPSSFLVAHYGGLGEVAQGFCRAAAVGGGVYILGRDVVSVRKGAGVVTAKGVEEAEEGEGEKGEGPTGGQSQRGEGYEVRLSDFDDTITCDVIIASEDYKGVLAGVLGSASSDEGKGEGGQRGWALARCIAIIDVPIRLNPPPTTVDDQAEPSQADEDSKETAANDEEEEPESPQEQEPPQNQGDQDQEPESPQDQDQPQEKIDTTVLVYPPGSFTPSVPTQDAGQQGAVTVLVTGEGSMCAPAGKWIVYLSTPLTTTTTTDPNPETLLRPYLDATIALGTTADPPTKELFSMFYVQRGPTSASASPPTTTTRTTPPPPPPPTTTPTTTTTETSPRITNLNPNPTILLTPHPPPHLPETADACAAEAERTFWGAVAALKERGTSAGGRRRAAAGKDERGTRGQEEEEGEGEVVGDSLGIEVGSFWPVGDGREEEEEEEW